MPKRNNRPTQKLLPKMHIYCEGEKTEPNYLNGYIAKNFPGNRLLQVIKIEPTKKNTPKELVNEAIKDKGNKNTPEGDIFWVVYDCEGRQKYSDSDHNIANQRAVSNKIRTAFSNVCFEVWLLLHFQNSVAPYSCYDDLRKNSTLRNECKQRGLIDYDKGEQDILNIFSDEEITKAKERAKNMNANTINSSDSSSTKPHQWNPYTNVYELLNAIDTFEDDYIKK